MTPLCVTAAQIIVMNERMFGMRIHASIRCTGMKVRRIVVTLRLLLQEKTHASHPILRAVPHLIQMIQNEKEIPRTQILLRPIRIKIRGEKSHTQPLNIITTISKESKHQEQNHNISQYPNHNSLIQALKRMLMATRQPQDLNHQDLNHQDLNHQDLNHQDLNHQDLNQLVLP